MSKTQAMWIKIKEPMEERSPWRNTDKGSNSTLCSQRGQNTSPSYLFDCNFTKAFSITQRKQLWGILCDCSQPKIEFDVQDEPKLFLFFPSSSPFLLRKTTLWVFESGPIQLPPTVPHSASLSPLPLTDCLLPWQWKKVQLWESFGLNEKNQPIWLTFLANVIIFCCQGVTFSLEQFMGSSHLYPSGQWRLSDSHILHRGPMAWCAKMWKHLEVQMHVHC